MTPKTFFDNLRAVTIEDLQEAANDYTSVAALASEVVSMFDDLDVDQEDIDFYDTLRDCNRLIVLSGFSRPVTISSDPSVTMRSVLSSLVYNLIVFAGDFCKGHVFKADIERIAGRIALTDLKMFTEWLEESF
jgi:hypothetical protein